MKTKHVGSILAVALAMTWVVLPVSAQSYGQTSYLRTYYRSKLAISAARDALGYIPPAPSSTYATSSLDMTQEQLDQLWALHARVEQMYATYVAMMHKAGKKVMLLKYVVPSKDPMLPDTIYVLPAEGLPPSIANAIPASATSAVSVPATSH